MRRYVKRTFLMNIFTILGICLVWSDRGQFQINISIFLFQATVISDSNCLPLTQPVCVLKRGPTHCPPIQVSLHFWRSVANGPTRTSNSTSLMTRKALDSMPVHIRLGPTSGPLPDNKLPLYVTLGAEKIN